MPDKRSIMKVLDGDRASGRETCSFCGRPASRERRLLAGPKAYICSDCIVKCNAVLRENPAPPKG
jgi:ATP-dependent Clp protease ATP-binding subunit ClpX